MTRDEKKLIIDSLTEKLKENPFFYITDASGFSVAEVNAFRRTCFERGVEYKVYKNTLIAKALENLDAYYSTLADGALKGFSGILFAKETGNLPAKVLLDFRKKQGKKSIDLYLKELVSIQMYFWAKPISLYFLRSNLRRNCLVSLLACCNLLRRTSFLHCNLVKTTLLVC